MKYYHITPSENLQSILWNGLQANNDNQIFFYSGWEIGTKHINCTALICDFIAINQLGLKEFAIFEISSKGIKTEIQNDNVGELTAKFQFHINQSKISKSYIKFVGYRQVDVERIKQFYLELYKIEV
jgi:hypothetical protein